jgi:hypothetical protein
MQHGLPKHTYPTISLHISQPKDHKLNFHYCENLKSIAVGAGRNGIATKMISCNICQSFPTGKKGADSALEKVQETLQHTQK